LFAVGAYPGAARALRAAGEWLPGGLDTAALRVLGKSLVFTEQAGEAELQHAFDRCVAEGADITAAVVATELAHAAWHRGEGALAAERVATALSLTAEADPSYELAQVLSQVARFKMLAGAPEEAIAIADRAIALADETEAHGARASALITRATANGNLGVYTTIREDFEEARVFALKYDESEVNRVYVNLTSILIDVGDLDDALVLGSEGRSYNERRGTSGGTGGFIYGNLAEAHFLLGQWGPAEEIAVAELERARRVGGLYYEPFFRFALAELALVRDGKTAEAADTVEQVLELSRQRGDAQTMIPGLALAAWTFARTDRTAQSHACLDELLASRRADPHAYLVGYWTMFAALALERLGRSGELSALAEQPGSRFLEAALAVDAGDFAAASRLLQEIGARQLEAETRLLAARDARRAGDEALADVEETRARALLEELGATARLRELDAMPAT
jgi:tetratricopeptide (TPR) repeat protein